MRKPILLSVISALGLWTGPLWADGTMRPGAWQARMVVTATNPETGEKINVGETTTTLCLTEEFLASDPYLSPSMNEEKMRGKGLACASSDYQRDGASAQWKTSCQSSDGKTIEGTVSVRLSEMTAQVDMYQRVSQGEKAGEMLMANQMSYAGECTDDMPRQ